MSINKARSKTVTLIIAGGIAAVKTLDLIRRLREDNCNVHVILTHNGARFVTAESINALTGNPVATSLWEVRADGQMPHIRLARDADVIIVSPATAHLIARMANGLADDLATTVLLATDKPVLIAPAMNVMMWNNPATQQNIATLRQRGVHFIGPGYGALACGEVGFGRIAEPAEIYDAVNALLGRNDALKNMHAIVTSGPTYEALDPVRFLGNHSSGKQGHAIAATLAKYGARTTLITGPVSLATPYGVDAIHVTSAAEMLAACQAALPADIFVAAAAVSDWRPAVQAQHKLKKHNKNSDRDSAEDSAESSENANDTPTIKLVANPDILRAIANHATQRPRLVIGFAAETENLTANASSKLLAKGCDWLLANQVGNGKAFGTAENEVTLLCRSSSGDIAQTEAWPKMMKEAVAEKLVEKICSFIKKG